MNKINQLDHLGPIADEMLAGLQTDEAMRLRIVRAARAKKQPGMKYMKRFAPAAAFAAVALVCVGAAFARLDDGVSVMPVMPVAIDEIAAGEPVVSGARMIADLGDGANVRAGRASGDSLFAQGGADIPLVAFGGAVYRMLETPQDVGGSLLGGTVASVNAVTEQPSLASAGEMNNGLSNVAAQSSAIYAVKGVASTSLVAAKVDGNMRLFQRVSYAGKGPGRASLEETFAVRGKVRTLELTGVGTLQGETANRVIGVLLDSATLKQADASARKQFLTVTLENGLRLQLGVSGDMLSGCGGWSCPEFFDAFEAALR